MIRSTLTLLADSLTRRPVWVERDGDNLIEAQGYSAVENLIYGAIAAAMILLPIALVLAVMP